MQMMLSNFLLVRALDFVAHVVARGGVVLFVSSHRETLTAVEAMAEEVRERREGTR